MKTGKFLVQTERGTLEKPFFLVRIMLCYSAPANPVKSIRLKYENPGFSFYLVVFH